MSLRRPTAACTVFTFCYKPFMWCRPDARLWHYYSAFSARGVFQTLVWHPHNYFAFSARGVFQTLVWHQYYYSAVSARGVIQTLAWYPVFIYVLSNWLTYSCTSCLHLLYLMSELSCEYFHSTHLACGFGQMLTKAISWMKSLIARPMPRGVPVSPARSRILVTCIVYASATRNKSSRASLRCSKSCSLLESYHSLRDDISTTVIIMS